MSDCRSCACGCCTGIHAETPVTISNRPGLSAIAYRVGTHPTWKHSMLAALTGQDNPLSGKLTTRDDDDFSIALLDGWATVADVLTFYQERIANESYLRTARERLSLLQLAKLIGYELAPAVAAEVMLAFTIDGEATRETVTIEAGTQVQSIPGQNETPQTFETSSALQARAEWNAIPVRATFDALIADTHTYVAGTATNLKPGDALLFSPSNELRLITAVEPDFDHQRTHLQWEPALKEPRTGVSAMRVSGPLFGHNSPKPPILPKDVPNRLEPNTPNDAAEWTFVFAGKTIYLDGSHPELRKGMDVVMIRTGKVRHFTINEADVISMSRYAVSGKATRLELTSDTNLGDFDGPSYRRTVVYTANEPLALAERPRTSFSGNKIELAASIAPFSGERQVIIAGPDFFTGKPRSEPAVVAGVETSGGRSTITLVSGVALFIAEKTVVYGNVVEASHGETVKQVIGSGDATRPFQRFALNRAPLTFLSSPESARGVASTLAVYVNELKWREVLSLYGASPRDRVYRITRDDEEKSAVRFGDGRDQGSRLPSGSDNVRAVYRVGAGTTGNVRAGQLSMLMTQPYGVKEVVNPLPAEGGVDPELFADARRNAPRTVMTIDRVVSLRDYQSFAAAFQGIGKALATWSWLGTGREVFLTVAGSKGEAIGPTHPLRKDLLAALRRFGKPHIAIRLESYKPVRFRIKATVKIDPDAVAAGVMKNVRAAL